MTWLAWMLGGLALAGGGYVVVKKIQKSERVRRNLIEGARTSFLNPDRPGGYGTEQYQADVKRAQAAAARGEDTHQARYAISAPGGVYTQGHAVTVG